MIVDAAVYRDGYRLPDDFDFATAPGLIAQEGCFAWIGLHEPSEAEFENTAKTFHLHEVAVEDAVTAHQRPKLETYDHTLFVVLKPARYVDPVEIIEFGEIMVFVAPDFAVAVRHGEASQLIQARRLLEHDPERLSCGPGSVLHAISSHVVRDYAYVLDDLGADIKSIEEDVFGGRGDAERIYRLKQEVLKFHEAAQPLEEALYRLSTEEFPAVDPTLRPYFRDVYDHLLRVMDRINHFRDTLTSVLAANLTQVSLRQNADMRKISAYVAIAAIPTLLAGIWGMNFENMPEIRAAWGYPVALIVMGLVCLYLYTRFKKSGWL